MDLTGFFLMMRIGKQFQHFQVNDREAYQLPNNARPHEASEARGCGGIISLLIWFSVGKLFWHKYILNIE